MQKFFVDDTSLFTVVKDKNKSAMGLLLENAFQSRPWQICPRGCVFKEKETAKSSNHKS